MRSTSKLAFRFAICVAAVTAIVAVLYVVSVSDRPFTAALTLLATVLAFSVAWGLQYALFLAVVAAVGFSWLVPPVGSFHFDDPRELIALVAFLITGLTASLLSERARREAQNAERRRAQAAAAQQRFADLVNSVEGIVWEADADPFVFSFVSEQAERILGYPVVQWVQEPSFWKDRLHPEDRDWAVQFRIEATAEKRGHDFEYRMIAADGRVVWTRDLVTVVVENGRPTRLRGIIVDVTRRKQAEDALRQAQAALEHATRVTTLGELAASLAHELNQPLAAMVNNANACLGLLPSGSSSVDEVRAALADIVSDAERASAIIERVRGMAKRSVPERVPLRVGDVVEDVVSLAARESAARRIAIHTEVPADLPAVLGDRVQLQQVLLNLVVNAMDAMSTVNEPNRKLEIRARLDTDGGSPAVRVSVEDRGIGLDAGQTHRLFEAFYTTKAYGMGMGLAISRSIIEAHGGRLWAEANRGPGATFSFDLPVGETSPAA